MSIRADNELLRRVLGAALAKDRLPWYGRILISFTGPHLSVGTTADGPLIVSAGGRWVQRLKFLYDPQHKTIEVISYVGGPWEHGVGRVIDMLRRLGINLGGQLHPWPEISSQSMGFCPVARPPAKS